MSADENLKQFTEQTKTRSTYYKRYEHSFSSDFLEAFAAGLAAKGLLFPFENLQTYLSLREDYRAFKRRDAYMAGIPKMMKDSGVMSLLKGIGTYSLRNGLNFGFDIAVFHTLKNSIYDPQYVRRDIHFKPNLICGLLTGFLNFLVLTPFIEAGINQSGTSTFKAMVQSITKNGLGSVYKFWKFDLPSVVISRGVLLGLVETKFRRQNLQMNGNVPYFMRFFDAYALSLFTGFLCLPFEFTKRRIMKQLEGNPDQKIDMDKLAKRDGGLSLKLGVSRLFLSQISVALGFVAYFHFLQGRNIVEIHVA